MRCRHCGSEMKIKKIKTGTDENGNPIYQKYAYCYDCKIKRRVGVPADRTRKKKRKLIPIVVLLLLLVLMAGGIFLFTKLQGGDKKKTAASKHTYENIVTAEAFKQLKTGMSLSEVNDLIKTPGTLLTRSAGEEATTERYQWITKNGTGTVLLTFADEKLISLSQTGMYHENSSINLDKLSDVKPGMTVEEINALLGSDGILISETVSGGTTSSIYGFGQEGLSYQATFTFIDGACQAENLPDSSADNKK